MSELTRARPLALTGPVALTAVLWIVATGAFVGGVTWSMQHASYDTWGGMLVGLGLAAVSTPVIAAAQRREADERAKRLLPWVFIIKMLVALVFLFVAQKVYAGSADANYYFSQAAKLTPQFRHGDFSHIGTVVGLGFVPSVAACFYVVAGVTKLGGYFFFSWIGFWGLYLSYRAFVRAVPDGDSWRYFKFTFFLPSLVFWNSSLGKEALMLFGIGLAANGVSRLMTTARGGFLVTGLGLLTTAMVRPHLTVLLVVSLVAAYAVRRAPKRASILAPVWRIAGLLVLLVASYVVARQAQHFLNLKDLSSGSISKELRTTQDKTGAFTGGSQVRAPGLHSIRDVPKAFTYVLFQPFPWQVHNVQAFITSIEGSALLAFCVAGRKRLRRAMSVLRQQPYVAFALIYTVLFVVAFSNVGNFGLIARERTQVYPMLLVVLALPLAGRARARIRHRG